MNNVFYDTNALLELQEKVFENKFYISSNTLREIENIKTSKTKTDDVRYKARKIARLLDAHFGEYEVVNFCDDMTLPPDVRILKDASFVMSDIDKTVEFITDDISCKNIARNVFHIPTKGIHEKVEPDYTGFKEVTMSETEMAHFYENLNENTYDLLVNQYILVKNDKDEIVDKYVWTGETHESVYGKQIKSMYFDKLKVKDNYQAFAVDSLMRNTITAISGKAGSGKSLLSLMCAMHLIETGKYDRLVVMFNPTKTRGASDLGFYAGDFITKAMSNSIGQVLTTKFGDRYAVDVLLQQDKIKLVSMADARGMEVRDNEILWITEAQNTSIDLIKLCLSRCSSGAKIFLEGDYTSQVDSAFFEGENNGLKRVINAFKGQKLFGCIQLQNVWRSEIAELCELL